ncbi:MAG: PP2C family protein-serine/threonine phosphatase, partial [Bacteroidota bacterium]
QQERMKHELAIARQIQMASLPQQTPKIEGLDIAGSSVPALEVGGDYFDYLNGDPKKLTVIVGDVSGKGTSAALYMSKVQGILRSLHQFGLSPKELFVRTNKLLCQDMEKKSFVTAIGGFFTPGEKQLILARAGHLPLYYYDAEKAVVERITPKGLGLGLEAAHLFSSELEERIVPYHPNDIFLFVSDGITEAEGENGGQFGEESLMEHLRASAGRPAEEILNSLLAAVHSFANGKEQHDDQTVVVVKAL